MSDFTSFKDLIPRALARYKLGRQARAAMVCQRFRELAVSVIGEDSEGQVKAKYFRGHKLTVSVPSSLWAQRVYVHRHDILTQINLDLEPYGSDLVHEIFTVVESDRESLSPDSA